MLEIWRDVLESKGFLLSRLSRTKTAYAKCKFSKSEGVLKLMVKRVREKF